MDGQGKPNIRMVEVHEVKVSKNFPLVTQAYKVIMKKNSSTTKKKPLSGSTTGGIAGFSLPYMLRFFVQNSFDFDGLLIFRVGASFFSWLMI